MKIDEMIWGDLFCGGGGTTTGAMAVKGVKVAWALNHDSIAITTHAKNHPETKHFQADIRSQNEKELTKVDGLWASLECTNFSNAKGGQSREADSRTLAWELPRYANHTQAKYIIIENVKEFMAWGPLDAQGKPVSRLKGRDYLKWIEHMKSIGYVNYEYRLLNSADYGAYTSRTRYFGILSRVGCKITFPEASHTKKPGLFALKKWKACKEKINLKEEGRSVFGRKKPLVKNTLKRIAAGMKKFDKDILFILKYYGTGKNVTSVNKPLHTITTKDRHALISLKNKKMQFVTQQYGRDNANIDINNNQNSLVIPTIRQFIGDHCWGETSQKLEEPLNTVLTRETKQLITIEKKQIISDFTQELHQFVNFPKTLQFLTKYYGGDYHNQSLELPYPTISTVDHNAVISTFISSSYNSNGNPGVNVSSLDNPLGSIMTVQKHSIVSSKVEANKKSKFVESVLNTEKSDFICKYLGIEIPQDLDLSFFDIFIRFLTARELADITGFPEEYKFNGSKKYQIKMIGNAVVPVMAKVLINSLLTEFIQMRIVA